MVSTLDRADHVVALRIGASIRAGDVFQIFNGSAVPWLWPMTVAPERRAFI